MSKVWHFISFLNEFWLEWNKDKISHKAAALAFYTIFSLAPLVIITITVTGTIFGQENARTELYHQIAQLIGNNGAKTVDSLLRSTHENRGSGLMTLIGFLTMFVGASAIFSNLQDSLNGIWNVTDKPKGNFFYFIKSRFLSFIMVLIIGLLLLTSIIISATITFIRSQLYLINDSVIPVWETVNAVTSLALITILFAFIFKILSHVPTHWKEVWAGAFLSSLLFALGKFFISLYLTHNKVISAYGAAGSLVVLLIWIYYSAHILFLGIEFTKVLRKKRLHHS